MPMLDFKGKQHVYAHHLGVPYRPLVPDAERSPGERESDGNLIIHGDNLHALKALLPRYAGRVKCVYIDPPYNTGNEGWVYSDRVNGKLMREWLTRNGPVDGEDLERHDKWLCMMWPRLHLLKELLTEDGVIFVSIDDNEHHHLRMLMDEIFGEENFLASFLWRKKGTSTNVRGASISPIADYQVCYRKSYLAVIKQRATPKGARRHPHKDGEGNYRTEIIEKRNDGAYERRSMQYQILGQSPREGRRWQIGEKTARELEKRNRFIIDKQGIIKRKIYDFEDKDTKSANPTYLPESCGSSDGANKMLTGILGSNNFENPKPFELTRHLIELASDKDAVVLDSFAGSGTTAHAVLALNREDGGNRKFILVECEDYADSITAERVRRVIKGVPAARDEALREGLGGAFTYCTLGEPIDEEGMLTGEALPPYSALAAYLLHTAAGLSAGDAALERANEDGLFYRGEGTDYYLLYEPGLDWLRGGEGILNEEKAGRIGEVCRKEGRTAVVFGACKYISQRDLSGMRITFCQLPYELHRRIGEKA